MNDTNDIKKQVMELTEGHDLLSISTEEDYAGAMKLADAAYERKKSIEEWFKPKVEAANATHKLLTKERGELVKPLDALISHINRIGGAYKAQQTRQAQIAQDAALKAAKKAGVDTSLIPVEAPKVDLGEGRTIVETWGFEILDENLIPREYLIVDEVKIRKIVVAMKDKTAIPGVTAVKQESIRRTGSH
jgi:hypothetical protein